MSDPNDPRGPLIDPFDFPPATPAPTRGIELTREEESALLRRAGLPALVLPFEAPTAPASRPVFPTGPAANDPIFSQAARLLKIGGAVVAGAVFLDFVIRQAQEDQINREQRERDEVDELIARRLGADNPLPIVLVSDVDFAAAARTESEFPKVDFEELPVEPEIPFEQIQEIPGVQIQFPSQRPAGLPETLPDPVFTPASDPALPLFGDPLGTERPQPFETPTTLPRVSPRPATRPGFGVPGVLSPPATPAPLRFPRRLPTSFPTFRPVSDPLPRTLAQPRPGPSSLTSPQRGILELPQALPQPQQQPRRDRCKPCKEDFPEPRDKCFKGLYREGALDTEVEFTAWEEIPCDVSLDASTIGSVTGSNDNVIPLPTF